MQKHCVAVVCLAFAWLASGSPTSAILQDLSMPLLTAQNLTYLGGFRVPKERSGGDSFDYGGGPIAYNPARDSLFVGSGGLRVAEITIPQVINSSNPDALPLAMYLQPFADPTEGHWRDIDPSMIFGGLLVSGNRLYGSGSIYYDANNNQRVSHFSRSVQLDQTSFSGWSQVWNAGKSGLVSGPMAMVPPEWQARLGGPAVTGQCCIPIVSRTSSGPAAFSFDPSQIGAATVSASPLLYYPGGNETLGPWAGSNPTYGATTIMGGVALIGGTRTALYFGSNGLGAHCYGDGTSNQSQAGPNNTEPCYDPTSADKGSHAYPYRYQIWAYDLNDLAAVKAGTKLPWEVTPYGVWQLNLPTPEPKMRIGGVGYDPQRQIIYVSQLRADQAGYAYRPVIHAFRVNGAPTTNAPPSSTVTSVVIGSDKVAPQTPGTPVGFLAIPSGGAAPLQYRWSLFDGASWTVIANWGMSNRYDWTPAGSNASFQIGVAVRGSGNTAPEATATMSFPISASTTTGRISSVAIAPDRPSPQSPGTSITWTATATGGSAPRQYKWLLYDGSAWKLVSDWSTTNRFTWTPAVANSSYRVSVWVRSAGNSVNAFEASSEAAFAIGVAGATSPVTAVTLSANRVAPQRVGATVTWTANATGGVAPRQYKWFVFDGTTSTDTPGWSTSNTFAWTPTTVNPRYRVSVWVRSSGATSGYEASAEAAFAIEGATTSAELTAVTLRMDKVAPQPAGSTIAFTATPTGGASPQQYKWFVYDGANWVVASNWSIQNAFSWRPATPNARYRVAVWVRSAGSTNDYLEVSAETGFPIQ